MLMLEKNPSSTKKAHTRDPPQPPSRPPIPVSLSPRPKNFDLVDVGY